MSIVGTRPPTLDEWNKYELHLRARLAIKPGITGMRDITTAENVKDAASEAMGKIELTMSGLKKTKKNNEKYVAEYKNMKEIRDEAKNNCRRIPIK